MKPRKPSRSLKSFQELKGLLDSKSLSFPNRQPPDFEDHKKRLNPESEEELFKNAMEGVIAIKRDKFVKRVSQDRFSENSRNREEDETLLRLRDLVKYGKGFNISDTPEYIEGTGYHVHPSVAKRLHKGDFSIQAHVDLHGLLADQAKEVFEKFLKWAVMRGMTGILIIHGRGLSSPLEPVLKRKVVEWLTHGPWRKWVIAYSSARICDGGAGATYVLLRQRPISKRLKLGRFKNERKRE
jgi:DNA-nicking Smr family endonuclease